MKDTPKFDRKIARQLINRAEQALKELRHEIERSCQHTNYSTSADSDGPFRTCNECGHWWYP